MYSLRKFIWIALLAVGSLLACIVIIGFLQNRLAEEYRGVLSSNERLLFHFMTIRENLTERMVRNQWAGLDPIISDIEELNGELSRLKENRRISSELKLALVNNVDLAGLVILLRENAGSPKEEHTLEILKQLRSIADYLIQYDRIMVTEARERIVHFQQVVIGFLGLIISLASLSLVWVYRNTVSPLVKIAAQLRNHGVEEFQPQFQYRTVREIEEIAAVMEELAVRKRQGGNGGKDDDGLYSRVENTVNETINQLNGIINYAQLLLDGAEEQQLSEEQIRMLQRIISHGSEVAEEWRRINVPGSSV